MRRRELIILLGAAVAARPLAARAQQKTRRIAYLALGSRFQTEPFFGAFREGLRALGYRDDDIEIEIRYADGYRDRLPDLVAELVRLTPEIIVTGTNAGILVAKQATSTIPIVMVGVADPVTTGLVASLAHPGGNVTGLANLAQETVGKRLQLLKTTIPGAERIAILINPDNPAAILQLEAARQAAPTLRVELLSVEARVPGEIDGAFATMTREHADALVVVTDPVFGLARDKIAELATSHKLPANYQSREFAAVGGLMSYGANQTELFRYVAAYVDKILKGSKPADLPIEQPTKFEMVLNLKTANVLGLAVPQSILARADEVIE